MEHAEVFSPFTQNISFTAMGNPSRAKALFLARLSSDSFAKFKDFSSLKWIYALNLLSFFNNWIYSSIYSFAENNLLLRPSNISVTPKLAKFFIYSITFGTLNEFDIVSGELFTTFSW